MMVVLVCGELDLYELSFYHVKHIEACPQVNIRFVLKFCGRYSFL